MEKAKKQVVDKKQILNRFKIIIAIVILIFCAVIYKAYTHVYIDGEVWREISKKSIRENVEIASERGNIYDCNNNLLAATLPEFDLYIDFRSPGINDSVFEANVDTLSLALSNYLKDRPAADYKRDLIKARRDRMASFRLSKVKVDFNQLEVIKKFPYFRQGRNKSGLIDRKRMKRVNPYGTLASRTIGGVYAEIGKGGKSGFEEFFDTTLRGTPGLATREKVLMQYITKVENHPVRGKDIQTTIDIQLQDIVERALKIAMNRCSATSGLAILMHTKTGEIRALTNMALAPDSTYFEARNYAIGDAEQPGSTIKAASFTVAVDDGYLKPSDLIDRGNGVIKIGNQVISDHNAHRKIEAVISAQEVLAQSSNVGVYKIIDKYYHNQRQKFYDGYDRIGLTQKFDIPINGAAAPFIPNPKNSGKPGGHYYSNTTLGSMAFGYETRIPAINMLAFYNALANNGKMLEPLFVKAILENGIPIKEFKAKVVREMICSKSTIETMKSMLRNVVVNGTAKPVNSPYITIAGKTGTAIIAPGEVDFRKDKTSYRFVFAGFFPSDDPEYSCIVMVRNPAFGFNTGNTSGLAFRIIAEQVYAQTLRTDVKELAKDTVRSRLPYVKRSDGQILANAFESLRIGHKGVLEAGNIFAIQNDSINLYTQLIHTEKGAVPLVVGMGITDAIYQLEQRGIKVRLKGAGKVTKQSIAPGTKIGKDMQITLELNI